MTIYILILILQLFCLYYRGYFKELTLSVTLDPVKFYFLLNELVGSVTHRIYIT